MIIIYYYYEIKIYLSKKTFQLHLLNFFNVLLIIYLSVH